MRFEIGQQIWVSRYDPIAPVYEVCPDCGGTGRLRVIFHDDTEVSIECRNCSAGYGKPTGRVIVYRNRVCAYLATITGVEMNGKETRWQIDWTSGGGRIIGDDEAFDNEVDALVYGHVRMEHYEQEQRERIRSKERDTRTWAWNASYHRKRIKEAQQQIEYHSAKLAVAAIKAKDKAA